MPKKNNRKFIQNLSINALKFSLESLKLNSEDFITEWDMASNHDQFNFQKRKKKFFSITKFLRSKYFWKIFCFGQSKKAKIVKSEPKLNRIYQWRYWKPLKNVEMLILAIFP